jgi:hypothetical protein
MRCTHHIWDSRKVILSHPFSACATRMRMKSKKARLGSLYRKSWCSKKGREAQESNMRPAKRIAANQGGCSGNRGRIAKKKNNSRL